MLLQVFWKGSNMIIALFLVLWNHPSMAQKVHKYYTNTVLLLLLLL